MINYFSKVFQEGAVEEAVEVGNIIAMTPVKLHTHLPNKNHSFDACAKAPALPRGFWNKFVICQAKSSLDSYLEVYNCRWQ